MNCYLHAQEPLCDLLVTRASCVATIRFLFCHHADAASPLTKASEWTMSHAGWMAVIALAFLVGRVTTLLRPGLGGGAARSARAAATGTDKVM
jgi:hypothetical protein